jgi:hypothetical protein
LVLFVEKTTQKYQFSISNIIFLDVKPKISGIKSSLGYGFFILTTKNTTCGIFNNCQPLEKMSEQ